MNTSVENASNSQNINCPNCKQLVIKSNFCMKCSYEFENIEKCPICMLEKQVKTITCCGNNACSECLDIWFSENDTCPICRRNKNTGEIGNEISDEINNENNNIINQDLQYELEIYNTIEPFYNLFNYVNNDSINNTTNITNSIRNSDINRISNTNTNFNVESNIATESNTFTESDNIINNLQAYWNPNNGANFTESNNNIISYIINYAFPERNNFQEIT